MTDKKNDLYERFLEAQGTNTNIRDSYGEASASRMPEAKSRFLKSVRKIYKTMYDTIHNTPDFPAVAGYAIEPDIYTNYVKEARLWFVATDAADLIAQAAPSVPLDTTLDAGTLRLLQRSLPLLIGYGGEGITSMEWDDRETERVPLRFLFCYPAIYEGETVIVTEWISCIAAPNGNEAWSSLSSQMIRIGETIDSVKDEDLSDLHKSSVIEDRQILVATLSLIAQERIISTELSPVTRQAKRQAERGGRNIDTDRVRISDLRPAIKEDRERNESKSGRYYHRWVVEGHWRSQPHGPKNSLRKPVWISPYLKGPDDGPLLTGEKVKVLR